jgi:RecA/RadA recombinase
MVRARREIIADVAQTIRCSHLFEGEISMSKWLSRITSDFGVVAAELTKKTLPPVPTRSPSLNWATSIGGFQPGKISVLYGPEQSGKSLLAMMAIADEQKRDQDAIFIWFDAEFSFNLPLFIKIGGDPTRLVVRKTNDPIKIFDYVGGEMLELLQEGAPIRGIVVDSIKAIRYPKEANMKQTTDQKMGGTGASYLPTALKLIIPVISEYNLLTFFIQQVTMEIDPMKALRNPFVITEGKALKHAADIMLEIVKLDTKNGVLESGETITGAAQQTGHKVRIKVKKNRLGVPARMAQFTYHYDHGIIDQGGEIFELAKSLGVVFHPVNPSTGKENTMMWAFGNYDPIRGEDNTRQWVIANKKIQEEVLSACYEFKDKVVELDASGVVIEADDLVDLNLGV